MAGQSEAWSRAAETYEREFIDPYRPDVRSPPPDAAHKNAAILAEHALYDFAFGRFCFEGIEQHFWQPFEIGYRLRRAGFRRVRRARVRLSWEQFHADAELRKLPPPWDWFFEA